MTHDELVSRAAKWLRSQGCGVVIHDGMRANTGSGEQPDAMCPACLIEPDELPEDWGLLYATEKTIQRVHGVPGNTQWHNRPLMGAKECEIEIMYSALRRLNLRGCLERIYEPVIGSEK